jgi:hypothetical protein
MYSGGNGYFGLISSGPHPAPDTGAFAHQNGTSFFRIFNDHWQIIGLDSAYLDNDLDPRQLPALNTWLGLTEGDRNPPPDGRPRRTILLSHHQLGSSRAQSSVGPGIREKTAEAREKGLIAAWIWGHEHRAFVYDSYLGVPCPVCLGNGGVPELRSHVFTFTAAFQWVVDMVQRFAGLLRPRRWAASPPRVRFEPKLHPVDSEGHRWEQLGFVVLTLNGEHGAAVYHGEEDETYEIDTFGQFAHASPRHRRWWRPSSMTA